jgi:hypothetical protein
MHLWFLLPPHPLLAQLPSQFEPQIRDESKWGAGQRPKDSLKGPFFTIRTGCIMPQNYAIKGSHGCTTFSRNSFARLCCYYSLRETSLLIKNILEPFHLGNPHHLLSGLAWNSFTIYFKYSSCKKSSILGVQEPSLGGRRDPKSPFSLVFSFH